jgi:hypothetical protein
MLSDRTPGSMVTPTAKQRSTEMKMTEVAEIIKIDQVMDVSVDVQIKPMAGRELLHRFEEAEALSVLECG